MKINKDLVLRETRYRLSLSGSLDLENIARSVAHEMGVPIEHDRANQWKLLAKFCSRPWSGQHRKRWLGPFGCVNVKTLVPPFGPLAEPIVEHTATSESHSQRQTTADKTWAAKVNSLAFLKSYEWRRLRMVVLKKRGARCECCGASPTDGATVLHVDHIKPRRLFPRLALVETNCQILCAACNHGKGNWDQTDWRPEVKPVEPSVRERWHAQSLATPSPLTESEACLIWRASAERVKH